MTKRKEIPILIDDKPELKLYEENKSIRNLLPEILELSIAKCPISCNNCKVVYSNKSTGIKIICYCSCHNKALLEIN
ncbi:MAG: hypothetical protein L0H53_02695 [Candidatus Nitrosocosmicus sp.]|nr:hypothetical protein [Candidatus Nitrosocosmicus sp.]MDN5868345.1 hypothetical protein [Candidatus Nitrosocosmicus sp.]